MRAFTLIELVVVLAILGILTAVMFANYRGSATSVASRQSLQDIAQALRNAENRALAGSCSSALCSFGVHFDVASSDFTIFEDGLVALNGQYDLGESLEFISLGENILISSLLPNYICGVSQCADVLFEPPDPAVSFMPVSASSLVISLTSGASVTVGGGGSIDIN